MSMFLNEGPASPMGVLAFCCVMLALVLARCWPRQPARQRQAAARLLLDVAMAALLGSALARLVHHLPAQPPCTSVLHGLAAWAWQTLIGLLAAAVWAVRQLRHQAPLRLPVIGSAMLALLIWSGAAAVLSRQAPPGIAATSTTKTAAAGACGEPANNRPSNGCRAEARRALP
ncbi:hypothetical protein RZA67_07295 [Stenotrophomonas sp. C3(2023)]|uniref:hypothetical protein n=1 Tax=Stenotrophomonas sp. C3(2023) TaxID=3080277 RepID=UPI00293C86C2|nr:hypothetical protein [Stenotrophomonas sp. C3(2023)]MDV3468531.1 hypothetical protein [Stenotrophomonas sp. C3(2023)]